MFTRTTGVLIVPMWLASMGWLFTHDVWPGWTALDPPRIRASAWSEDHENVQYSLYSDGQPIGSIWTSYSVSEDSVQGRDVVWLDRLPIPVVPLRVTIDSVFTPDGLLDEFTARLESDAGEFKLHGERFHADFSFTLESDPLKDVMSFKVPLADGGIIAGAFSPFSRFSDLKVGRRWRMQVFNPLAVLTGFGDRFVSTLVEVTGEEIISTPSGSCRCFVIESQNGKAWVDRRGAVQVQELVLPVGGTIRIVRQRGFDEALRASRRDVRFKNGR